MAPPAKPPVTVLLTTSRLFNPVTGRSIPRGSLAVVKASHAARLVKAGHAAPATDRDLKRASAAAIDLTA